MTQNRRTLREWRARLSKTKQDMASLLNVHPSTYAKWENTPQEMKIVDVDRLIKILGCEIDEIIFFE
ncbi:helix-turn-helix transcriptional regulator [Paenibacillus sp. MER 78]|uniref:helix-turn-helix transcriptional regulator n=1 Tax=Paenibacillus sp. MER 78 TaxID=2939571 RepID=UPI0037C86498